MTNLVAFYHVITGWVDGGRAVDAVYLDFNKAFDTISHRILVMKLRKCGIDEWTVKWAENWLTGRAQRVVISGTESSWRPVFSSVPQGQCWVWSCSTSSSVTLVRGWCPLSVRCYMKLGGMADTPEGCAAIQ